MPKRSILTERFRRVSTPDVFRRSSKIEAGLQPLPEASPPPRPANFARSKSVPETLISHSTKTNLLTLPTEIYAEILSHIDFVALCSFRLACRTTHYLVSSGDIVRRWISDNVNAHQLDLHPVPSPPTFFNIMEQHRRTSTVAETAFVLVEYIEHEILRHTLRRANIDTDQYRQGLFGLVKIRLSEKMMPLLGTIQAYLELKSNLLLADKVTPTHTSATHTEDSDHECTFFRSLAPSHLHQAHKCFLFLTWLSNSILSRPSYAGAMERTMRGWLSDPLDVVNYRLYFLFGGVGALGRLVGLPSYKHRRKVVEAWGRGLDPGQNILWKDNWAKMVAKYGAIPTQQEVVKALDVRLDVEECWVRGAREVLAEKDLLKVEEEVEVGSPFQTMDFLCDIAGYDILHTPPSWTTPMDPYY